MSARGAMAYQSAVRPEEVTASSGAQAQVVPSDRVSSRPGAPPSTVSARTKYCPSSKQS